MPTRIKPKRGSGSPAGSLEQYEIAMDVNTNTLYVSADGVGAQVLAQNISNNTTDDLAVGTTNLYYTSSLFDTDFATKTTSDLTEGTNLYYTDARVDARIALLDTIDDLTITNTLSVTGNTDLLAEPNNPLVLNGAGSENAHITVKPGEVAFGEFLEFNHRTGNNHMFTNFILQDNGGGDDGTHSVYFNLNGDGNTISSNLWNDDFSTFIRAQLTLEGTPLVLQTRNSSQPVRISPNRSIAMELYDTEISVRPNDTEVMLIDDALIDVKAPIESNSNITTTTDLIARSIELGTSSNYFNDSGTLNANYVNVQSPSSYSSSAQFQHTLNTGDTFHQFIRFKTDMTNQTPYSHQFGFFAQTTSDANGTENVGSVNFQYDDTGEHFFVLASEGYINSTNMGGTDVLLGSVRSADFRRPIGLFKVPASASAPGSPSDGDTYFDTTLEELRVYAGGWVALTTTNGMMFYDDTNHRTIVRENGAWRVVTTTAL